MAAQPSTGYNQAVYLAESSLGYHKIGISKHPEKRVDQLNVPGVLDLRLIHIIPAMFARRTERLLHDALQEYRVSSEWFRLPPHLIAALCEFEGEHDILDYFGHFTT